jgi:gliding motility associated protien GldN
MNEKEVTMNGVVKQSILFLFILSAQQASSQPCNYTSSATVMNGAYPHTGTPSKKPFAYPYVREADVMWAKRVWRVIDLREKINHPYYYPLAPVDGKIALFDILKCAVYNGEIVAFGNPVMDDQFQVPLTLAEFKAMMTNVDSIMTIDPDTEKESWKLDTMEISPENIKQYWIKEDWFFDKQRSVMDVRIIGICPLRESVSESGEVRGYQPLFWIYFPEARKVLARNEAFTRVNDSQRLSFDDMFEKRFFSSYIRKESNVYDRTIPEYKTGLDALLEAEKIKEEMFNIEHDMWHY